MSSMETYSTALILGYGRSGQAAERLLRAEGCDTVALAEESADAAALHAALRSRDFDVCIVSPGFRTSHPWLGAVEAAGVPPLAELELGWSRHRGRTVAVTGSNGKSTAVKWMAEMLVQAGHTAVIGGNYGIPACEAVLDHPDAEWLVLEVSSFQLETVRDFHAEVAVLLNIRPNHLDRHGTMDLYRRTKARIFGSSSLPGGACLVPVDRLAQLQRDVDGARRWITFGEAPEADFRYSEGRIFQGSQAVLDLRDTPFESPVLGRCTGAATAATAAATGAGFGAAEAAARCFKPLPHRLQRLGEAGGVTYINDSKATNLAAVAAALQSCKSGIHLIAGGLPKESDYTFIKEILAERTRRIYLTGQASRAMYEAWNGVCPCMECGSLETAFNSAREAAKPGETILLSPGCASFDRFSGFEERGERFMQLFRESVQGGGDAS
jgi:UDP-N-acetylmuramoylalanine--D-glutamate ligase